MLSINSNLRENLAFTLITIASITGAVALATALEMTSRAVVVGVSRTTDALAGTAKIEIVGGDAGVKESSLEVVARVPGVIAASPLLTATFQLAELKAPLWVVGIDFAAEREVREYTVEQDDVRIRDPLRLLVRPESVVVSPALSRIVDAGLGDRIPVRADGKDLDLVVEGMLREGGLADAFGGQVAAMDVYSLQLHVGRVGWFDRIDVGLEGGIPIDDAIERIQKALGPTATVRRAAAAGGFAGAIASSVRRTMLVIAGIGGVVAALLCFSAISLAIANRGHEFLLLRSVGAGPGFVRRTVWHDCIALSLIGTALGLVAGVYASSALLSVSGVLPGLFGTAGLRSSDLVFTASSLWAGIAVGLGATVVAAVRSAETAVRGSVVELVIESGSDRRRSGVMMTVGMLLCAVGLIPDVPPTVRAALLFTGAITALGSLASYLPPLRQAARPLFEAVAPKIGSLIAVGLAASARSTMLTIVSISSVVALVTIISTFKESFATSLVHVATNQHPDAVRVRAGAPFLPGASESISAEVMRKIKESPFVARAIPWHQTTVFFRNTEVSLLATGVMAHGRSWMHVDEGPNCDAKAVAGGDVAVSRAFSRRFGVERGDTIQLETPAGAREIAVGCIFRSFGGSSGAIFFDVDAYAESWPLPPPIAAFLFPTGSVPEMIADLQKRTAGLQVVHFTDSSSIRSSVETAVDRFDGIVRILQVLALGMGAIAILNCLSGLVLKRAREYAVLKTTGASPAQLSRVMIADAGILALGGLAIGLPLGWILSHPMVELVGAVFGWSLQVAVDPAAIVESVFLMVAVALGATLYPIWRVYKTPSTEVFAP